MGAAKLHFVDAKLGLDQWTTTTWLAPLSDDGKQVSWAEGSAPPDLRSRLTKAPAAANAEFAALPGPALRGDTWPAFGKSVRAHLLGCEACFTFYVELLMLEVAAEAGRLPTLPPGRAGDLSFLTGGGEDGG